MSYFDYANRRPDPYLDGGDENSPVRVRIADSPPIPVLLPSQHLATLLQRSVRFGPHGLTKDRYRIDVSALSESQQRELLEWLSDEPQDFQPTYHVVDDSGGTVTVSAPLVVPRDGWKVEPWRGRATIVVDLEEGR